MVMISGQFAAPVDINVGLRALKVQAEGNPCTLENCHALDKLLNEFIESF